LVSAEQSNQQITQVDVTSTVGGALKRLSPWPSIQVEWLRMGTVETLTPDAKGIVTLMTKAGDEMRFTRP
jgi:hypothetical protein